MKWMRMGAILLIATACPVLAQTMQDHQHHKPTEEKDPPSQPVGQLEIPDLELIDQDGKTVRFYQDLVRGRLVAMNFIFTTCTTVCPPMGANFARLQTLAREVQDELALISVSVDPVVDTPQRLKAWKQKFQGKPGWTLVTGPKQEVDRLLKSLRVFTPDKNDHAPFVLIGDEKQGNWQRVYGLAPPQKLLEVVNDVAHAEPSQPSGQPPFANDHSDLSPAERYFGNVVVLDQDGSKKQLYRDLLQGKVVVMHSFFGGCQGTCPVILKTAQDLQARLGDRLGEQVHLLSLSVDPLNDTPPKLKALADKMGAKPGWYFLTGEKQNVDTALHKFGQYIEDRESHSNILIVGNEATGLWKKVFGLAPGSEIWRVVEAVLEDKGE